MSNVLNGKGTSVLEEKIFIQVRGLIQAHYELSVQKILRTAFGSADCFFADTDKGRVFVKIYQKKHEIAQIEKEIQICTLLKKRGLMVSQYRKNREGEWISRTALGLLTIQDYIKGMTYEKFQVPDKVLIESAGLLADIHQALEEVSGLTEDFSEGWIQEIANEERSAEKIEQVLRLAESLPSYGYKDQILRDCRWKLSILPKLSSMKSDFSDLTRKNSHGDYNTYQWICEDEKIKAVIDFGNCSRLPVIWELIRSYTYGASECKEGRLIDLDRYQSYLGGYLEKASLSRGDLERGFAFYFYSLASSVFGYKQSIEAYQKGTVHPLIHFALWRTEMARYLFEKAEELDEQVGRTVFIGQEGRQLDCPPAW